MQYDPTHIEMQHLASFLIYIIQMKQNQNEQGVNLTTGFKEMKSIDPEIFNLSKDTYMSWGRPKSKYLFDRVKEGLAWLSKQNDQRLWLYNRVMLTGPSTEVLAKDDNNNITYGINFASADYLGLAQNQNAVEAAISAAKEFGCNSAGSPLAFGATKYYMQLRSELAAFWQVKSILIYSAGWLAGFGVIKGLIRDYDHIVMDRLAHNCLVQGAHASTKNISRFNHLDTEDMEKKIKAVREKDGENAILVITEGLFSMDSDTPDLNRVQQICKKYDAYLLLDCAHDFGCMGENGRGTWELQGLKDRSNVILLGTGSKCLSTNIGFVGCNEEGVIEYLKFFSTAYMFTNAINPVQAATSLANLRILSSQQGKRLRRKVFENYVYLRKRLEEKGHTIFGNPCPILPLRVGNQIVCRLVSRIMMDNGIHVNGIEYPVVTPGEARLRVNLMPQHTKQHLDTFVEKFEFSLKKANQIFDKTIEIMDNKMKEIPSKL